MGTFGTGIFSDDFASDIMDEFKELIGDGKTPELATKELLDSYADSLEDESESTVFWLALSAVQWKTGRLLDHVKIKALSIIEDGSNLKQWREEAETKDVQKREKALLDLKEQLLSAQPQVKKIRKAYKEFTPFEVGDVFSYSHSSGNFALFRVIGHFEDRGGRMAQCEILDYFAPAIINDPQQLADLSFITAYKNDPLRDPVSKFLLGDPRIKHQPKEKVKLVAKKIPVMQNGNSPSNLIFWKDLDDRLSYFFEFATTS